MSRKALLFGKGDMITAHLHICLFAFDGHTLRDDHRKDYFRYIPCIRGGIGAA